MHRQHDCKKAEQNPHLQTIIHNIYSASLDGRLVGDLTLHGALIEFLFSERVRPCAAPGLSTEAKGSGTCGTPANRGKCLLHME